MAQIKSVDLGSIVPEMLKMSLEPGRVNRINLSRPSKPELGEEEMDEKLNETFKTARHDYQETSEYFDPIDLEFEKYPQLNEDYMNQEHKLMSSDEKINKSQEKERQKPPKEEETGEAEEEEKKEPDSEEKAGSAKGGILLIREMYQTYFSKDYFLKKNGLKICPGDLLLLYDNLGSVLKRNISYSKFVMGKNEELEERIRIMEQRNRMLSRELQSISERWKKEGKMDISRYQLTQESTS